MNAEITVIYYEDNASLREGISFLMGATAGLKLLGAYENCDRVGEQIRSLKPDVVLMDIDLPGVNGIEAIKVVRGISPVTEVIILTVFDDEDKIFRAIRNGASGYLLKSSSPGEVTEAIFDTRRGGSPMTSNVARKVLQYFQHPPKTQNYSLSERELEIVQGLLKGFSYKMIASSMDIKIDTVRSHIRNIYDKLQVNSKTEAILKAMQHNLVKNIERD